MRRDKVGHGADVGERRLVHPAWVLADVVVQRNVELIAEPGAERLQGSRRTAPRRRDQVCRRRVPCAVTSSTRAGARVKSLMFDVVNHRRVGPIDRIAQDRRRPDVPGSCSRSARRRRRGRALHIVYSGVASPTIDSPPHPANCARYHSTPRDSNRCGELKKPISCRDA